MAVATPTATRATRTTAARIQRALELTVFVGGASGAGSGNGLWVMVDGFLASGGDVDVGPVRFPEFRQGKNRAVVHLGV